MGLHVEVRVLALVVLQRVGVGHQVTAHPVGVDQLDHPGGLVDLVVLRDRDVLDPAHRLVGHAQAGEHPVVEAVVAEQLAVKEPEELSRLRPLDDAVVVGGGEGDGLADGEAGEGLLTGAGVLGRVLQRTDTDDRALAAHESWHGVDRPDGAGVGQ